MTLRNLEKPNRCSALFIVCFAAMSSTKCTRQHLEQEPSTAAANTPGSYLNLDQTVCGSQTCFKRAKLGSWPSRAWLIRQEVEHFESRRLRPPAAERLCFNSILFTVLLIPLKQTLWAPGSVAPPLFLPLPTVIRDQLSVIITSAPTSLNLLAANISKRL